MRYSDYRQQLVRLEKAIDAYRAERESAEAGKGPWLGRLFPARRHAAIAKATRKLTALCSERAQLERAYFGAPSIIRNIDMTAALQQTISPAAIEQLQATAAAALSMNS